MACDDPPTSSRRAADLRVEGNGDRCPGRCAMPDGNGTLCLETGVLLPAGPCRDCERRPEAGRWRQA